MTERLILRGIDLRYALTQWINLFGPCTIDELCDGLAHWGFAVHGRPSKTVSDALRWEMNYGRVIRRARGRYGPGCIPRATDYRITQRVLALREKVSRTNVSLGGGQQPSPDFR